MRRYARTERWCGDAYQIVRPSEEALLVRVGELTAAVHDHLGSPRLVIDTQSGEIAQRLDYDVHGRVLVDTAPDF